MTKKYILAIAIFVCFLFSTMLINLNHNVVPIEVREVFNNKVYGDTGIKEVKKEEEGYKINVYYPETKYKNLNEHIVSKINNEQDNFFKESSEIAKYIKDKKCILEITFNQYEYKDYISFAFETVVDLCGAHPSNYFFTVIYDTKKQQVIQIEDLLEKDENFLNKLSDESYLILKENEALKKYSDDENIKKGLKPIKSNFENIIFDKDKLILFINPYQVGPYVAGDFEVKISYSKIM